MNAPQTFISDMAVRSLQSPHPFYGFTEASLFERGFVACRQAGGIWVGVIRMTYGKGRLCADLNLEGYDDSWCYDTLDGAIAAMNAWDPEKQDEPEGWMRHINTARRRPDGDASKEYVLR